MLATASYNSPRRLRHRRSWSRSLQMRRCLPRAPLAHDGAPAQWSIASAPARQVPILVASRREGLPLLELVELGQPAPCTQVLQRCRRLTAGLKVLCGTAACRALPSTETSIWMDQAWYMLPTLPPSVQEFMERQLQVLPESCLETFSMPARRAAPRGWSALALVAMRVMCWMQVKRVACQWAAVQWSARPAAVIAKVALMVAPALAAVVAAHRLTMRVAASLVLTHALLVDHLPAERVDIHRLNKAAASTVLTPTLAAMEPLAAVAEVPLCIAATPDSLALPKQLLELGHPLAMGAVATLASLALPTPLLQVEYLLAVQ